MDRNNWRHKRRREIAEGLRELAASAGSEGVYDAELFCVLALGEGAEPDCSNAWDVEHLAGLIEPLTCSDLGSDGAGYDFVCSHCGFLSDLVEPKYCPNCGAEVVE